MPKRTQIEVRAKEFESQLMGLIISADGFSCKDKTRSACDRNRWSVVLDRLYSVRSLVRHHMMHPDDRD